MGGVVDDGGATAVDVAYNIKMAKYFEVTVLEGKMIGGRRDGLERYAFFYLIFLRVYVCELFDLGDP